MIAMGVLDVHSKEIASDRDADHDGPLVRLTIEEVFSAYASRCSQQQLLHSHICTGSRVWIPSLELKP